MIVVVVSLGIGDIVFAAENRLIDIDGDLEEKNY